MNHQKNYRKLGRTPSHRKALLRNMVTSFFLEGQIQTTLGKAKEVRRVAEKLITLGKVDSLHNRRRAMTYLRPINRQEEGNVRKLSAVHKLFTELGPKYAQRPGGYTRIIKTNVRHGDRAEMAVLQFVEAEMRSQSRKRKRQIRRIEEEPAKSEYREEDFSESENVGESD